LLILSPAIPRTEHPAATCERSQLVLHFLPRTESARFGWISFCGSNPQFRGHARAVVPSRSERVPVACRALSENLFSHCHTRWLRRAQRQRFSGAFFCLALIPVDEQYAAHVSLSISAGNLYHYFEAGRFLTTKDTKSHEGTTSRMHHSATWKDFNRKVRRERPRSPLRKTEPVKIPENPQKWRFPHIRSNME
jgi:hypothetical protein